MTEPVRLNESHSAPVYGTESLNDGALPNAEDFKTFVPKACYFP